MNFFLFFNIFEGFCSCLYLPEQLQIIGEYSQIYVHSIYNSVSSLVSRLNIFILFLEYAKKLAKISTKLETDVFPYRMLRLKVRTFYSRCSVQCVGRWLALKIVFYCQITYSDFYGVLVNTKYIYVYCL